MRARSLMGVAGLAVAAIVMPVTAAPAPALAAAPPLVQLTPGAGRPGTPYTLSGLCATEPQVTVTFQFGDTVEPVPVDPVSGGSWAADAEAGDTDATYTFTCEGESSKLTFDVENPIMVFTPVDGDEPVGVAGTDCDAGEVEVEFLVGFRPAVHQTVPTDERGDWSVAQLPPDAARLGVYVNATCGDDFMYETLEFNMRQWYASTTTTVVPTTAPPAGPAPAAPAVAQPGTATFTG